jgi:hypothetical protein
LKKNKQSINMKTAIILKRFLFVLALGISAVVVKAQGPGDPGVDPGGAGGAVPVDGGLSLLLGAGVAYGVKKGYDYRKKMKEEKNKVEL